MPIDYSEYPKDWKEIRQRILERANHCCEECNAPNHAIIYRKEKGKTDWGFMPEGHQADAMVGYGVKFTKIILTIAHLDHDKLNHDVKDERLKAVCQKCHLAYDLPRHIENRKYGRNFRKNQNELF
jgi:5-methylcytosine-specific restriction endonuclease McrA